MFYIKQMNKKNTNIVCEKKNNLDPSKSWRRTVVVLFGNYGYIRLTFLAREIPDFIFFVQGLIDYTDKTNCLSFVIPV